MSLLVAPLKSRAAVALAGPDWRSFLQNLITQDVEGLKPGEARFGALLTPQGRLLHDLFVVGLDEGALLDVEAEQRDGLIQRLSMYRLRAKVEIAPSDLAVAAAFAPGAQPADPPLAPPGGGAAARDPRLPALGWRLYGAALPTADEAAYEAHRLALGAPGPADWGSDRTYPIEADFDLLNGIDFGKGCFVGQETTSRMKRRGQIKNRMLPIVFDGPPPPFGAEVLAGDRRAGEALSGIDGRAIALVRLDRALGCELTVDGRPARADPPAWMAQALGAEAA